MVLNRFYERRDRELYLPNKFTIGMGELIKAARQEAGLTQAELSEKIYKRRASISEIENGKMRIEAETLIYLSIALNKPVLYFFPAQLLIGLTDIDGLADEENILVTAYRKLSLNNKRRIIELMSRMEKVEEFIEENIEASFRGQVEFIGKTMDDLEESLSAEADNTPE